VLGLGLGLGLDTMVEVHDFRWEVNFSGSATNVLLNIPKTVITRAISVTGIGEFRDNHTVLHTYQ